MIPQALWQQLSSISINELSAREGLRGSEHLVLHLLAPAAASFRGLVNSRTASGGAGHGTPISRPWSRLGQSGAAVSAKEKSSLAWRTSIRRISTICSTRLRARQILLAHAASGSISPSRGSKANARTSLTSSSSAASPANALNVFYVWGFVEAQGGTVMLGAGTSPPSEDAPESHEQWLDRPCPSALTTIANRRCR